MNKVTFKINERRRSNEEFGACDATRIETVHSTGRVEGRLFGIYNGREIDDRYVREHGPVDLQKVQESRVKAGWSTI